MITHLTFKPTSKRHGIAEISYNNGKTTTLETNRAYCETVAFNDRLPWSGPNEWSRA